MVAQAKLSSRYAEKLETVKKDLSVELFERQTKFANRLRCGPCGWRIVISRIIPYDSPPCYHSSMRHLLVLFIHLIAVLTQLFQPGGVRSLTVDPCTRRRWPPDSSETLPGCGIRSLQGIAVSQSQRPSPIRSFPCYQVRYESGTQLTLARR